MALAFCWAGEARQWCWALPLDAEDSVEVCDDLDEWCCAVCLGIAFAKIGRGVCAVITVIIGVAAVMGALIVAYMWARGDLDFSPGSSVTIEDLGGV